MCLRPRQKGLTAKFRNVEGRTIEADEWVENNVSFGRLFHFVVVIIVVQCHGPWVKHWLCLIILTRNDRRTALAELQCGY